MSKLLKPGIEKRIVLQPRDRALLEALKTFRVVSVEQAAEIAGFHSASRARARLAQLVAAKAIVPHHLGTIRDGRKTLYALPGTLKERRATRSFQSVLREQFFEHQLAVNGVCLAAKRGAPASVEPLRISTPIPTAQGIMPDALLGVGAPCSIGLFVEMDMGTEAKPVWSDKVRKYLELAASGYCSKTFGLKSFGVVVVAESEDRIEMIQKVIAEKTDVIFWLADTKTINREGFWGMVWRRPTGSQKHSLQRKENNETMQNMQTPDRR